MGTFKTSEAKTSCMMPESTKRMIECYKGIEKSYHDFIDAFTAKQNKLDADGVGGLECSDDITEPYLVYLQAARDAVAQAIKLDLCYYEDAIE